LTLNLNPCQLNCFDAALGQQGTEPDLRIYAVVHRCEVVMLEFASFTEGGSSRLFRLYVFEPKHREPTSGLEPLTCS
jgi:hypothetical protein